MIMRNHPGKRKPLKLIGTDKWVEAIEMLCYFCQRFPDCDVLEEMIKSKSSDKQIASGFCTDPGSEISCFSFKPKGYRTLSPQVIQEIRSKYSGLDMCSGCAARKGSDASMSLHTQRDFRKCVDDRSLFGCHDPRRKNEPCIGWLCAITKTANRDESSSSGNCLEGRRG